MILRKFCWKIAFLLPLGLVAESDGAPLPAENKKELIERKEFLPSQKHEALSGKVIGVLVAEPQAVLSTEGRSGPPDQLCLGMNGFSYRWVYVPTQGDAIITNLQVPLADGKIKVYPKLNMANFKGVKEWGITAPYTLVEVEVNDGLGSPKNDSFTATKMKVLEGSKEFPLNVTEVVNDVKKRYTNYLEDQAKTLDEAMKNAAKKAIKEEKPTGPKETSTVMFVTWMSGTEKLHVRFLTRITDGAYKYAEGIRIELPPPNREGPAQGGVAPPPRLPDGLRHGTQFGIELGMEYIINKTGKLDKQKYLELQSFANELAPPPINRPRPLPLPLPPAKR